MFWSWRNRDINIIELSASYIYHQDLPSNIYHIYIQILSNIKLYYIILYYILLYFILIYIYQVYVYVYSSLPYSRLPLYVRSSQDLKKSAPRGTARCVILGTVTATVNGSELGGMIPPLAHVGPRGWGWGWWGWGWRGWDGDGDDGGWKMWLWDGVVLVGGDFWSDFSGFLGWFWDGFKWSWWNPWYSETTPFPLSKCGSKSTLNLGGVSAESFPVAQSWAIMVMFEN